MTLQSGHLSESTPGGKEMMLGRWQGMMLGQNVRETLDQPYSRFPHNCGNPVSEFPLTYRSELIDGDSALFSVEAGV